MNKALNREEKKKRPPPCSIKKKKKGTWYYTYVKGDGKKRGIKKMVI